MKQVTALILIIMICTGTIFAGSFVLSFNQSTTDNIFQNRYGESDQLSQVGFYAEADLAGLSLYSEGSYSYLFRNRALSFYTQDIGLDYLFSMGRKSALYVSLTGRGAFFREDYSDFNHFGLNLLISWKSYLSETSIMRASYSLEGRNYSYNVFDSSRHSLLFSIDKYFQTRTTLKADLKWGVKTFLHPFETAEFEPDPAGGPAGKGKGKGATNRFYQSGIQSGEQGRSIQVLSLGALVAQGLGSKVGLNAAVRRQWTLSGENPFTFIEEYYMVENPSYDQFSWQGYQIESVLTLLLPWDIEAKMGYTWFTKTFPGIENMDLEGNGLGETRKDRRDMFQMNLGKHFSRISAFVSFAYVNNRSNDLFFGWKGYFVTAGLEWNFNLGGRK